MIPDAGEDVKQMEVSSIAGGKTKTATLENSLAVSYG